MTLDQLLAERNHIQKRLDWVNVRCEARERLLDRLAMVDAEIARIVA